MNDQNKIPSEKPFEKPSEKSSEKSPENVRQQAKQIDRDLQNLQQQIDAVDQAITTDRLNQIVQEGEQMAAKLEQPEDS